MPLSICLTSLLTEKIADLCSVVFRDSLDVIHSCLVFYLPEFSIRIAHPTDFMLVLGTRRFCGLFGMRETWKV